MVKDGRIAYLKAYGKARTEMRYSIGSVSKQFMAGAMLLLVQDGKLSLDDKVGRYLPNLTRAGEITIRQLLSHTSGYQDYYPLDYVAPYMQKPVTADEILKTWAGKPLDFDPGTRWQYSNTNYVAAGRILEGVTGMSAASFLQSRVFGPLGMTSVIDLDEKSLSDSDAAGYTRFGLGPARPVAARGTGLALRGGGTGDDRTRPGAMGRFADRTQAADGRLAGYDDESGASEERRADGLRNGSGGKGCGRTSDAATRRRCIGLCQPEHRVAGCESGGGGVCEHGWIEGAGSDHDGDRAAAGG